MPHNESLQPGSEVAEIAADLHASVQLFEPVSEVKVVPSKIISPYPRFDYSGLDTIEDCANCPVLFERERLAQTFERDGLSDGAQAMRASNQVLRALCRGQISESFSSGCSSAGYDSEETKRYAKAVIEFSGDEVPANSWVAVRLLEPMSKDAERVKVYAVTNRMKLSQINPVLESSNRLSSAQEQRYAQDFVRAVPVFDAIYSEVERRATLNEDFVPLFNFGSLGEAEWSGFQGEIEPKREWKSEGDYLSFRIDNPSDNDTYIQLEVTADRGILLTSLEQAFSKVGGVTQFFDLLSMYKQAAQRDNELYLENRKHGGHSRTTQTIKGLQPLTDALQDYGISIKAETPYKPTGR